MTPEWVCQQLLYQSQEVTYAPLRKAIADAVNTIRSLAAQVQPPPEDDDPHSTHKGAA